MRQHTRCWYCSRCDVELTDEHVLSQHNFGGRLVSPGSVCGECNREIGKLERRMASGAFLAEYVGRDRLLFAPPLPRPVVAGSTGDDARVRVSLGPAGATVVSREPRLLDREDDGTEIWEVAAGDEDRFRRRRQARNPETKLRVRGRAGSDAPGLNTKFGIGEANIDAWPRLGAKVALSLASQALDDGWLDTSGASALQTVLRRGVYDRAVLPDGLPFGPDELDPQEHPGRLLRRGEHLLSLDPDEGGWMIMILFGALHYQVPLPDARIPAEAPTWHLPPRMTPRGPLPEKQLVDELKARAHPSP